MKPDPMFLSIDSYPVLNTVGLRFQDLDINLHVNNVAIAAVFEEAAVRFLAKVFEMTELELLKESDLESVAAQSNIQHLEEVFYPESPVVDARVAKIGRSSYTVIEGLFQNQCCGAVQTGTTVNLKSGSSADLSRPIREELGRYMIKGLASA